MPPLGNGPAFGLPSTPLALAVDTPAYQTGGIPGGSHLYTPLAGPGAFGTGILSPYAKAILSTPGLTHWFRLGQAFTSVQNASASPPYFCSSASCMALRSQGGGTPKLAPGLLPGDTDPSCDLNGGYLDGFNYFTKGLGTQEILSVELWCYLRTLKGDTAFASSWLSSVGWIVYANTSTLSIYADGTHVDAANALTANKLHHIVAVWGGIQSPTPDYYSYVYVNGVQVINSLLATGGTLDTTARFEIGQYANGAGSNSVDGIVDEVSLYSRMLQPSEILAHYQAGFARA